MVSLGMMTNSSRRAYTLSGVNLELEKYKTIADLQEFLSKILEKVDDVRSQYRDYYDNLRKNTTTWANGTRTMLAVTGALAIVLTSIASGVRLINDGNLGAWTGADKWLLLAAMVLYALMGALAFFERGTNRASDYFRYLAVMLAIRDLWTKFQFEVLKELTALEAAADPAAAEKAARGRIVELAAAACADFDRLTSSELTDWTKADTAARSMLEAAAKSGLDEVYKRLDDRAKEIVKSDEAAAAAAKPGYVNATVSGSFDGEILISVDGEEAARSTGKVIALGEVKPGMRTITVTAKKGEVDHSWSKTVEVKPGPQGLAVPLA